MQPKIQTIYIKPKKQKGVRDSIFSSQTSSNQGPGKHRFRFPLICIIQHGSSLKEFYCNVMKEVIKQDVLKTQLCKYWEDSYSSSEKSQLQSSDAINSNLSLLNGKT